MHEHDPAWIIRAVAALNSFDTEATLAEIREKKPRTEEEIESAGNYEGITIMEKSCGALFAGMNPPLVLKTAGKLPEADMLDLRNKTVGLFGKFPPYYKKKITEAGSYVMEFERTGPEYRIVFESKSGWEITFAYNDNEDEMLMIAMRMCRVAVIGRLSTEETEKGVLKGLAHSEVEFIQALPTCNRSFNNKLIKDGIAQLCDSVGDVLATISTE